MIKSVLWGGASWEGPGGSEVSGRTRSSAAVLEGPMWPATPLALEICPPVLDIFPRVLARVLEIYP